MSTILTGKIKWDFRKGQFKNIFLNLFLKEINKKIKKYKSNIEKEIRELIKNTLLLSETAKELMPGGTLAAEFGIPLETGDSFVRAICEKTAQSAIVTVYTLKRRIGTSLFDGGISVKLVLDDYSDVLGLEEAVIDKPIDSGIQKEYSLRWLQWLLLEGTSIAIKLPKDGLSPALRDVEFYVHYKKGGRSGSAVMLPSKKGVGYRVHPKYGGTADDNWLTREFTGTNANPFLSQIKDIVFKYIG